MKDLSKLLAEAGVSLESWPALPPAGDLFGLPDQVGDEVAFGAIMEPSRGSITARVPYRPVKGNGARGRVLGWFRHAIARGELGPGDVLPSTRELGRQLRVDRRTVTRAMRDLERRGVVYRRPGGRLRRVSEHTPPRSTHGAIAGQSLSEPCPIPISRGARR